MGLVGVAAGWGHRFVRGRQTLIASERYALEPVADLDLVIRRWVASRVAGALGPEGLAHGSANQTPWSSQRSIAIPKRSARSSSLHRRPSVRGSYEYGDEMAQGAEPAWSSSPNGWPSSAP